MTIYPQKRTCFSHKNHKILEFIFNPALAKTAKDLCKEMPHVVIMY